MQTLKHRFAGRRRAAHTTARALGWFSIGLGIAELLASRGLARALGGPGGAAGVRACGLREIATGIGVLTARDPTPWIWGRVAGDAVDLAALGSGMARGGSKLGGSVALAAVAGVTMIDIANATVLSEVSRKRRTRWRDYSDRSGMPSLPQPSSTPNETRPVL